MSHVEIFQKKCGSSRHFLKSFQTVTADIDVEELSISSIVTFPKTTHRPHLVTNGFKEENQEDTKVVLKLDKVKGRLNIAVLTRERIAISKFDGWPEVSS